MVESPPKAVKGALSKADADALAAKLKGVGATVEVRADDAPDLGKPVEGKWGVQLESYNDAKIACIKVVRDHLKLGLKETKELVERAPVMVKHGATKEEAEAFVKQLNAAGGTAKALLASE
ncbi:MAG: ribosomal protein L7/L12 [Myxococcaceae bacterium]|nr:ribosomal protein L7/L12 [Myxococcaceae bacterium]